MGNCVGRKQEQYSQPRPLHVTNLMELPESYISRIFFLTSPRDVCRLAVVSKQFRSTAYSDAVWQKFLPRQCDNIKIRAVPPLEVSSKRELYFRLCNSILIDEGRKIFWLDRSTTKIGYMLSARELYIVWSENEHYWRWVSRNDSRFTELAELLKVCWLEINGQIVRSHLSAGTNYRVVFVFKFNERADGWSRLPIKFSIKAPDGKETETEKVLEGVAKDGWTEVVAGEFSVRDVEDNDDDPASIKFCMKEVATKCWKSGLLIDGVRIEPKTI